MLVSFRTGSPSGLLHHVEDAVLGRDDRGQLREDELGDRHQVALALEHPRELGQVRLEPVLLGVLLGRVPEVADHLVDVVLERRHLALGLDGDRAGQVALGDGGGDLGDGADLGGQVGGELVDVLGQVLPGAGGARHLGLAAELPLDAHLAGHGGHLLGEGRQRVGHLVDRVGQGRDLALGLDDQLALQVAVGDRRDDLGDPAHLAGQVAGHAVDAVGQVLPDARHAPHLRLAAELPLGADLAGDAGHLRGEGVELVDHRVDRVLELEDLPLDVDGDLLGEVAVGDGGGDLGDVPHLVGQVAGHAVDVVGQVLPDARHAAHLRLAAQPALGADLAGDAGDLARRSELSWSTIALIVFFSSRISPRTSTVTFFVRSPLATAVVTSAMLRTWPVRLPAMLLTLSVRSFQTPATPWTWAWPPSWPSVPTSRATRVTSEAKRVELVDHRVDRVLELEDLPLDVDGDLLAEVAVGDGGGDLGDVAHLAGEVAGHAVDAVGQVLPDARHAPHDRLAAELALGAHLARHAGDFRGEAS